MHLFHTRAYEIEELEQYILRSLIMDVPETERASLSKVQYSKSKTI